MKEWYLDLTPIGSPGLVKAPGPMTAAWRVAPPTPQNPAYIGDLLYVNVVLAAFESELGEIDGVFLNYSWRINSGFFRSVLGSRGAENPYIKGMYCWQKLVICPEKFSDQFTVEIAVKAECLEFWIADPEMYVGPGNDDEPDGP